MRQLFWANLIAVCSIALFAALSGWPLLRLSDNLVLMFGVFVHCSTMVILLGRNSPRGPGFLYNQGFSRDQIWWSILAASISSGLLASCAFWFAIASGLRSAMQEAHGNPWFPVVGSVESSLAVWILLEYILLLPPLHYAWIRARMPQRDPAAGWMQAIGILIFYCCCLSSMWPTGPGSYALPISLAIVPAGMTLIGGWRFHRQVEVQS